MQTRFRHIRWFLLAAGLIFAGAFWLRLDQIERRPLHADEGVQAYQTWQLLRGDGYSYDPADKHGPFLYYFSATLIKLTGGSAATLTESRLRGITLLAGLATVALLLTQARAVGAPVILLAATLVATAPLAILYDTYFVQETWFCFFTWALLLALWQFITRPSLPLAMFIGLLAGLMQATKETSVIHFAALGLAWVACRSHNPGNKFKYLLPASAVFILTYVVFYSAGFTHWSGVLDGLRAYTHYVDRSTGANHSQPWHYYLSILWPHRQGGILWGEPILLGTALAGFIAVWRSSTPSLIRLIAVFSVTLLLLYSLIPYKMPWLLLTPYIGLCLLAGHACVALSQAGTSRMFRFAAALLACLLVFISVRQISPATDRYANDARNPYLFLPTSADLPRLIKTLNATPPTTSLAIVSEDHAWPLAWYLRNRANTGYFSTPPANLSSYDLALVDSQLPTPAPTDAQAFGLRSDVLLWLTHRQP